MKLRTLVAAAALGSATLLGATVLSAPASAMPADNLANVATTNVDQVRMICNRWRCFWVPGPRYRAFGFVGRPFGFHRRHHRWW